MIRGTTPVHTFTLPLDTQMVKSIQIIYAQRGEVKLLRGSDDVKMSGNEVTVTLTQEDTLAFDHEQRVEIQVRVLTLGGEALASNVMYVFCERLLSDEVLT